MKSALYSLALVFAGVATAKPAHYDTPEKRQLTTSSFDYVIVGGGTAGLTLAERLTKNPAITVALVEAGSYYEVNNPLLSTTPAGDVFWAGSSSWDTNPLVDWSFVTEPQAGANNRKLHYPRGKCLGGSSARNFMIYQRATTQTMNKWAELTGDDSYKWDAFLPYYKRSVNFTSPSPTRAANASAEFQASAFETGAGPLQVSYANYAGPFSSWMEGGFNEIGIGQAEDFNSGMLMGAQYCSSTIDPATAARSSSQTSFLDAAKNRSNLKLYNSYTATKINFDTNKVATGVKVEGTLLSYTLNAKKEVILSAGAFQSPQLLMVSGVGPAAELNKWKIPIVKELAGVGQNMQDHIFFGPTYRVAVDTLTKVINSPIYLIARYAEYLSSKTGVLTNPVCDFLGWEKIPKTLRASLSAQAQQELSKFPEDWPELEYLSGPGYIGTFSSLPATQPNDGYQYGTILAALVAPLSRGTVSLASARGADKPLIDPKWLTAKTDQEVAVAGYKRARAAFQSKFMSRVTIGDEYWPGKNVSTDAQILNTIRDSLHTVYHASCTNKMGKAADPMAVVDSRARVFGVKNLRVVDSSAFAILPPGHPQSTVYALAEKIADDILKNGST